MSDRIDINDIQEVLRFSNVEDWLKTDTEKKAFAKYKEVYHELLNAEYKKRAYIDLYRNIRFTHHSQQTIDNVKEIAKLDKKIQALEIQLEDMEQSRLFKNVHKRILGEELPITNFNLKEKIVDSLGTVGIWIYFLLRLFVSVLPFVMIGQGFFLTMIFSGLSMLFPLSSVVFWIWGLVCAINGVQDIFAIIYYIAFIVLWIPFFISVVTSFFDNR